VRIWHPVSSLVRLSARRIQSELSEDLKGCTGYSPSPNLSARSKSIFTEEGCQFVRHRGVRSRIVSSRTQIACSVMSGSAPLMAATMAGKRSSVLRRPARASSFWQKAIADICGDCAQQSALRPLALSGKGGVDDAHHVFPGHVGLQAAHMGYPVPRRLVQPFHVAVLPRQTHLVQRRRIPGAKARIAVNPAFGTCACQPDLGAFADQGALEFGGGAQDLQGELALWGGRVDRVRE
jgi:hypothetical protein